MFLDDGEIITTYTLQGVQCTCIVHERVPISIILLFLYPCKPYYFYTRIFNLIFFPLLFHRALDDNGELFFIQVYYNIRARNNHKKLSNHIYLPTSAPNYRLLRFKKKKVYVCTYIVKVGLVHIVV